MFGGVTITAILVAFLADLLLSRRFVQTAGLRRARHMREHVVVIGLGSVGIRVVSDLAAAGYDVAGHRARREQPYPADRGRTRRAGDFRRLDDAPDAGIGARRSARGVAVVTDNDMENIETGIVLLEILGSDTRCRSSCAFRAARWALR